MKRRDLIITLNKREDTNEENEGKVLTNLLLKFIKNGTLDTCCMSEYVFLSLNNNNNL